MKVTILKLFCLAFLGLTCADPSVAFAMSYQPGQTLDPSCLPSDPTCVVTFVSTNSAASFIATSPTATSTFAGDTNVSGTTATNNLSVSGVAVIGNLTGVLKAVAGTVTSSLVSLTADVTGVLGNANGGTGLSATPTYGQVLVGNNTGGYSLTATSSLGILGGSSQWTTNGANVFYTGGNIGVGTSSPFAQFSVATPNGATGGLSTLFAIASSTQAGATSTLFVVSNSGNVGIATTTLSQTVNIDGTLSVNSIYQSSKSANWTFQLSNPSGSMLFKSTTGIPLTIGSNVQTGATLNMIPPAVLAAAFNFATNSAVRQVYTYTGNTSGQIASNIISVSDNATGGSSFTALALDTTLSSNATVNTYTIDSSTDCVNTPAANNLECHAGRFTTNMQANMGGTSGVSSGDGIGAKAAVSVTAAATYLGLADGFEVVDVQNSASTYSNYGQFIDSSGAYQGVNEDYGLTIESSAGPGWGTDVMWGNNRGGACGTSPCVLIGSRGKANATTKVAALTGIDFRNGVFSA